jgi:hypothetical protein
MGIDFFLNQDNSIIPAGCSFGSRASRQLSDANGVKKTQPSSANKQIPSAFRLCKTGKPK